MPAPAVIKVKCPHCADVKGVADPKPGDYSLTCTTCLGKFLLRIVADGDGFKSGTKALEPPPPAVVEETTDLSGTPPTPAAVDGPGARPGSAHETRTATPIYGDVTAGGETVGSAPKGEEDWPSSRKTLGGYLRIAELGHGGMGSVYKARQVSLDRDVAVKVMKRRWSHDGKVLARFTREAYAAAQLSHHNVVQIHDVGVDRDIHYFSMEFVDGQSLDQLIRERKRLPPDEAVGLVLQAARGLQVAHERGMIHRDVKPANLMLNRYGLVKVADLGLVKAPGPDDGVASAPGSPSSQVSDSATLALTLPNSTMGTPMYMAPEQADDPTKVDGRADIYALGCTLYALLTGRPPYDGETVHEIITKHKIAPLPAPETIVPGIPAQLSAIVRKMVEKRPEDRYRDCQGVITALEDYRNSRTGTAPFRPGRGHADRLTEAVQLFDAAPAARLRMPLVLGFVATCLAIMLLTGLTGRFRATLWFAALMAVAPAAAVVIAGIAHRGLLFERSRALLLGNRPKDWLTLAFGLVALLALVWVFQLTVLAILLAVVGIGCAFGYHALVGRPLTLQRAEALDIGEDLVKDLRLGGLDEFEIQAFVRDHSGPRWEEFFEALFGYDDKVVARARAKSGLGGKARPKFAAWREPIFAWIDRIERVRRSDREVAALRTIEMKSLLLQGVDDLYKARKAADKASKAMVAVAEKARSAALENALDAHATKFAMLQEMEKIAYDKTKGVMSVPHDAIPDEKAERFGFVKEIGNLLFGPRIRFIVGSLLVSACLAWMDQNDLIPGKGIVSRAATDVGAIDPSGAAGELQEDLRAKLGRLGEAQAETLRVPILPESVRRPLTGLNVGAAGLILIGSSLVSGWVGGLVAIAGAVVALIGHRYGMPDLLGYGGRWEAMIVGGALSVAGFVLGRFRR